MYTLQDQEPLDILAPEEKEEEDAHQERQCQERGQAQQRGQVQDRQKDSKDGGLCK